MTLVHLLTFEQAESGPGEETVSAEDVCERLAAQVRLLDGSSRTLVIAHGPGRAHLAVGGDAGRVVVAYATFDNEQFYQLADQSRAGTQVRVVAGGQPAD